MAVLKNWETAVVIGSGPSLTLEQVELVRKSRIKTIAINDCYKLCPWGILYASDLKWWIHHKDNIINQECWTIEGVGKVFNKRYKSPLLNEVPYTTEYGIYDDKIHHSSNSGYGAIQLARLFGVKKIILIGFDHKHTYGKAHWFGDHDKKVFTKNADHTDIWLEKIEQLLVDIDIEVVNCSIETAIKNCRRSTLDIELEDIYVK